MNFLPKNPVLEYEEDALEHIRKKYGFDSTEKVNEAIDILEDWIKKQEHFNKKDFTRRYLEATILSCKGSLERAKSRLDKMFTFRTLLPQFFGDFDPCKDFEQLFKLGTFCILPKQAPDYNRVVIMKVSGNKFYPDMIKHMFQFAVIVAEYLKLNEYSDGFIVINDYSEADLVEIVKNTNPVDLRNGCAIFKEGFSARLKGVHYLTNSKLVEVLVSLLRQSVKYKVGNRITANRDVEDLYKYVPREILPVEYGGQEKSIKILQDNFLKEISSTEARENLREINQAFTNEKLRQNAVFTDEYLGMAGTFRTLSVD